MLISFKSNDLVDIIGELRILLYTWRLKQKCQRTMGRISTWYDFFIVLEGHKSFKADQHPDLSHEQNSGDNNDTLL
jgi:hypothetical protein